MLRYLAMIWCCLAALPALGQTISVRSGEHENFTRLVFDRPLSTEWTLEKSDLGHVLRFDPATSIELRGLFELIPRERVRDVRAGEAEGEVELILNCDCRVEARLYRERYLIVDTFDPAQEDGAAITEQASGPVFLRPGPPILPIVLPDRPALSERAVPDAMPQPDPADTALQRRVDDARADLLSSLSQGSQDGLLDFIDPPPDGMGEGRPDLAARPLPLPDIPHLLLRSQTAIETARPEAPRPPLACIDIALLDIGGWSTGDSFEDQIGMLRQKVYGEFDRTDPEAAKALARLYLHFGFGAEAMEIAMLHGDGSPPWMAIDAIGHIMDHDTPPPSPPPGIEGCEGDLALWRALFDPEDLPSHPDDRLALKRSVLTLPSHLRQRLGVLAANRFLDAQAAEIANDLLAITRRNAVDQETGAVILGAQVQAAKGKTEEATETLEVLAEDDPRMTPQAMQSLVQLRLEKSEPITDDEIDLLETMLHEYRPTPDALTTVQALSGARLSRNEYEIGLDLLDREEPPAEVDRDLRSALIGDATVDAGDGLFLRLVSRVSASDLTDKTANAVAQRLIDLRLPDLAAPFLLPNTTRTEAADRRYLRAQVAALAGDVDSAEEQLIGLSNERAVSIRRQALGSGPEAPDEQAADLLSADPDTLFRARAWDRLAVQSEDDFLREVGRLARLPDTVDGADLTDPASLEAREAALATARDTRTMLQGLLSRTQLPEDRSDRPEQ